MAETPEEAAERLIASPYFAYRPAAEIASALRAQYVAGLEAAIVVCESCLADCACSVSIRELAEQAKRTP